MYLSLRWQLCCVMMCALHAWVAGRENTTMTLKQSLSRRQFVSSAVSATALSCLPGAERILARAAGPRGPARLDLVALTSHPAWRDQGMLTFATSPSPKPQRLPVPSLSIQDGGWPRRPEL